MKCTSCGTHFKSENKENVCPSCVAKEVLVSQPIELENQQPETPEETETPKEPETPEETDTPKEPETPEETDTPKAPETPEEIEAPKETQTEEPTLPYQVRVIIETLHCHRQPGAKNPVIGTIQKNQIVEIFAEGLGVGSSKWGKLSDEQGWIALDYCSRTL